MQFSEHIKVTKLSYDGDYICRWQWINSGLKEKMSKSKIKVGGGVSEVHKP